MNGRIPQAFIDELLARTDIVELIDSFVPLKKSGANFQARCPFHNEKTPSFSVSPSKQFYHCFGCHMHGTALGFLMEYNHLSFPEAVQELAQRAGLTMPTDGRHGTLRGEDYAPLYNTLAAAARYYQRQLKSHPQKERAVNYLKQRGLTGTIAAHFGLGYAPPGWDNLLTALGGAAESLLSQTGLAIARDSSEGYYDRFRERVMFPIRDNRGRVIGFGGRVIDSREQPKYLNSPETAVFHKGQELYGLYEARLAQRKLTQLIVVEGYMDVVALAQHGVTHAVATLGTAITPEHIQRLFRTVNDVVFCFDGDDAGRAAAWRALEQVLPAMRDGRQARFMFLPQGEDPDSLIRQEGKERFIDRVSHSVPLSEYFYAHLSEQVDIGSMEGRSRLEELAKPFLSNMSTGAFRDMMIERLSSLVRQDVNKVARRLGSAAATAPSAERKTSAGAPMLPLIGAIIRLLLQRPDLAKWAEVEPTALAGLSLRGVEVLQEMLEICRGTSPVNAAILIEHWRDQPVGPRLADLAAQTLAIAEEGIEAEFRDAWRRLMVQRDEQRVAVLLGKAPAFAMTAAEKMELKELLARKHAAKNS